ncbi:MAG: hypothetical protein N0E58_13570 [Candidatus Thiodiazotropha endolucinida]|uniref:Uncharacterized protein n=1 Tax=Candidatus Thiodiazotropha taylori TaxID=2792791 RepID=A0A9E4NKQ7_9GAMM|nr:hypothetical protein [Candidatus Thiodiazotropha taylori]MCW4237275.1 hypothetical protein [Candidatus Thiodiazotropha endolucinida]
MYHKLFIIISIFSFSFLFQGCGGGGGSSGGGTQDPVTFTAYTDLSWISPKTRTDGSYLISTSIAGYKVYYGNDNDNLKLLVDIQGTGIDEYRIGVPTAGSYFFAIAAYDIQGIEGELSNIELKDAISFDD